MGEFVNLEKKDGVGVIRIDRAPVNALNRQLVSELSEVTRKAGLDEEVRSVVIWGGPTVFAAGADVKEFTSMTAATMYHYGHFLQEAFSQLADLPKITIAAVNGFALGGGCELAMTADFRYAADDAQLGQPEILLGLIPGAGGTQRLTRLVGIQKSKELIYTGKIVGAEEALSLGLVDRVVPAAEVFDRAMKAAKRYAQGPLVALKAAKSAINRGIDSDLTTGLAIERAAFSALFATEDREIGVNSFLEKGPGQAQFVGR